MAKILPIRQHLVFLDKLPEIDANILYHIIKNRTMKYFGIKKSDYATTVWPKDLGIGDYIQFPIAGLTHCENVDKYLGEFAGRLIPEPDNPFDSEAIKVVANDGSKVGYVPKDQTQYVRAFTKLPCKCYAYIGKNNDVFFSCCYIISPDL